MRRPNSLALSIGARKDAHGGPRWSPVLILAAGALVNLGVALAVRGNPQKAVKVLQQAVHVDPRFADARYNLGFALLQVGRSDEATEGFRAALAIDPDHAAAREALSAATNRGRR